jgi:hypothetical protein
LISDNLKTRKESNFEDYKSRFGENVKYRMDRNIELSQECIVKGNGVEHEGRIYDVDLVNCTCTCGKYQSYLIPCSHGCAIILSLGADPYKHVSLIYSKETLNRMLIDLVPVVDEPVKYPSDKYFFRRGPGRPKKGSLPRKRCDVNAQVLV